MANINDVAKLANVSRATVSRVINDYPFVDNRKRLIVKKAMEQLGYRPSIIAKQLRSNRTGIIAVVVPRIGNAFFSLLLEGMEELSREKKYRIILCQTGNDRKIEWDFYQLLSHRQVDGIITATSNITPRRMQEIADSGPVVFCSEYREGNIPSVHIDNELSSYMAIRYLLELGHRRIAICMHHETVMMHRRLTGYLRAMREYEVEVKDEWIIRDLADFDDGKTAAMKILSLDPAPTAAFATSDEIATGIIRRMKEMGVPVPDRFSVVGFDNQPIAEIVDPPLTTVDYPIRQLGRKTFEMVLTMIETKAPPDPLQIVLPTHLVFRQSTAPPPKE